MKKVIEGKLYDTETADLICEYSYGRSSDFRYLYEALYKTTKGQWFIAYDGGAQSKYAADYGDGIGGSEGIKLVDEDDARRFVEQNGNADDFEKAFGPVEVG